MARRGRRGPRGARMNYIKPDMGWWADQGHMDFNYIEPIGATGASFGTAETIMQFNDITDDDSLILRDNSDWFIKRILLEVFPAVQTNGADAFSPRRLYTCSIGTIDNDKLAEWVVNQPHTLLEPGGYEMWARMLRTYNKPVYHEWQPRIKVGDDDSGALQVNEGVDGEILAFRQGAPFWGFSHISDDFSVSNAGLKPEQSLSLGVSILNSNDMWGEEDYFAMWWSIRVLLQKRRAA